jgi:Protein of unknown function (DUF1501)
MISRRSLLKGSLCTTAMNAAMEMLAGQRASATPRAPRARAKRLIYLFQSGGPSQVDLFDPKPTLRRLAGKPLPESIRNGQRLTGMTALQSQLALTPSPYAFAPAGDAGMEMSELIPHIGSISEELTLVRSLCTEQINHDPATTFSLTGFQNAGRPSIGAWLSYGLGKLSEELPTFIVLTSNGTGNPNDQPLYDRLWGTGFLPAQHQGVRLRSGKDPILYLADPAGVDRATRYRFVEKIGTMNRIHMRTTHSPETEARTAQYELAFRMQAAVPSLVDLRDEPASTYQRYGEQARKPGTYAANCLLARRLIERGVRCVQLFHRGWDQHRQLQQQLPGQCRDVDQASAALVMDLKERGLLDETLVVWGGEFGRTAYAQGNYGSTDFGRDHHPRCFSTWLAGGGIRRGYVHGKTDEFGYNIVEDPVEVHDLNATILAALGLDHTRLTYRALGRDYRLTDVAGRVVDKLLV